ncbi:glycosyltransferase family 2 protein [Heliorestis acidaminivorans]|uniref:Glycosyltransferase family 2 protein n=1 Tax=Heliorestis acidaminivorans TaxID=553427 RepID=A0A6I0F001_9FIRM|nr:glycosyltransferase [Heliorestis acidaminivorans]KAB2951558.1 glycosyltransferase family 2 protein [Heliorestis acidaminivorans]
MPIEYSVVMPTYNRSYQLMLTLTSLERQTVAPDQYEVIVVNDGSTDDTLERLQSYKPPYAFQYYSTTSRGGPGLARNQGVAKAEGRYIIFCDSDFFTLPHFIESFQQYHRQEEEAIVSATPYCFQGIFTHLYPDFSDWERQLAYYTLLRSGLWKDDYHSWSQIVEVIEPQDVRNDRSIIQKVLSPQDLVPKEMKAEFRATDVAPWLLFITRCVAVKKESFLKLGGFDERLIRGAGEDWELGYRFYKAGYSFLAMNEQIGYHQEHPHAYRAPYKDFVPFHKLLLDRYGEKSDLLLLSLWDSSDDLWPDIIKYKQVLRKLRYKEILNQPYDDTELLLLQACQKAASRWRQ